MKPEEKHELQQNDLESFLYYRLPHYLKEYGSYIILAISLVFLGYQLWNWNATKQAVKLQNAWVDLGRASEPTVANPRGKLLEVINSYDIRPVQAQAWLRIGRFFNETIIAGNPLAGVRDVKVTREEALDGAKKAFDTVVRDFADQPIAVAAAHLNLGTVAENRGEWDAAKKEYEIVADEKGPWANTAFASEAKRKIKNLDEIKTQVAFGPRSRESLLQSLKMFQPGADIPLLNTSPQFGPVERTTSGPSTGAPLETPKK